jgi:hypothetical protein
MEKEILIKKAKKILDYYAINYEDKEVSFFETDDPILIELDENQKNVYNIFFESTHQTMPGINDPLIAFDVDRKTHKILTLISKHYLYNIPEELQ